jgi:peptide deformylase
VVKPFLMYPDKRLLTICTPVETIDDSVRGIWDDMLNAMYRMPGVGLAAPQIGVTQRLAVVDCSGTHNAAIRMANPEVIHASAKMNEHEEASPNLPDLSGKVERPRAVTVRYMNEDGDLVEKDFVHLWATSVQHQIDHLNGKLYVHLLSPTKRKMLLAKHVKNMKRRG